MMASSPNNSPKEYSPFTPGIPVPLDFFAGRVAEVHNLVNKAGAAATGRFERVFVMGDRGVGKSSLCRYAAVAAENRHQVLSLHVFLGGVTQLTEMVRRVFETILKVSADQPWYDSIRDFFGDRVRQVGFFGVTLEFQARPEDLDRLVHQFAPALRNLLDKLRDTRTSLMLVLDDLNGLADSSAFADWMKSFVDEVAIAPEPLPLLLVLVGLPERRTQLVEAQPSLARIFDLVEIKPLSRSETEGFFRQAFDSVNVAVQDDALNTLWHFSSGFPVFCHEIGDATFKADTDHVVDIGDARNGVRAAAEVIGRKYLRPQVYEAISSPRYRSILAKLAGEDPVLRRKDLIAKLSPDERRVLDNFLRKMRQLGVLRPVRELGRGVYEFTSLLYLLYFWFETQRATRHTG
jgi:type II secretory pathway predicted ATPase ExeA